MVLSVAYACLTGSQEAQARRWQLWTNPEGHSVSLRPAWVTHSGYVSKNTAGRHAAPLAFSVTVAFSIIGGLSAHHHQDWRCLGRE